VKVTVVIREPEAKNTGSEPKGNHVSRYTSPVRGCIANEPFRPFVCFPFTLQIIGHLAIAHFKFFRIVAHRIPPESGICCHCIHSRVEVRARSLDQNVGREREARRTLSCR